jgi:hypothetical protein
MSTVGRGSASSWTRPHRQGSGATGGGARHLTAPVSTCTRRVAQCAGRPVGCPHCGLRGHHDLVAARDIATRGGGASLPSVDMPVGRSFTAEPNSTCPVSPWPDVTPRPYQHHGGDAEAAGRLIRARPAYLANTVASATSLRDMNCAPLSFMCMRRRSNIWIMCGRPMV